MAATCAYVKEGQPKWQVTDGRAAMGRPHPDYPTGSCFYLRCQDTTSLRREGGGVVAALPGRFGIRSVPGLLVGVAVGIVLIAAALVTLLLAPRRG